MKLTDKQAWAGFKQALTASNHPGRYGYIKYFLVAVYASMAHLAVWLMALASCFALIAYTPWYICYPLLAIIINPMIGGPYCMLVVMENEARGRINMAHLEDFHPLQSTLFITGLCCLKRFSKYKPPNILEK